MLLLQFPQVIICQSSNGVYIDDGVYNTAEANGHSEVCQYIMGSLGNASNDGIQTNIDIM